MTIIIGGRCQGKLDFAARKFNAKKILNCENDKLDNFQEFDAINKLNFMIKRFIADGKSDEEIRIIVMNLDNDVIICDEIGCAIVSMEKADRRLVELTGRICCDLSKKAENVIRIYCGIPQVIKGSI
ncbi:MAG: hypothetical protein RSD67_08070 [Oscillospiraceae bacterium]